MAQVIGANTVVVESLMSASIADCAAIATKLGMRPSAFMRSVLQAPSSIVSGLTQDKAEYYKSTLANIGLDVTLRKDPIKDEEIHLFDVSIYVQEMSQIYDISLQLGVFLGIPVEQIVKMLSSPSGVIIGEVSSSTIDVITKKLASFSVDIVASNKSTSLYNIYIPKSSPLILSQVEQATSRHFETFSVDGGGFIEGLDYESAQKCWERLRTLPGIIVINQDFLRWDINLCSIPRDEIDLSSLSQVTKIPLEFCEKVIANAPLIVCEAVRNDDVLKIVNELSSLGLDITADLLSFKHFVVRIDGEIHTGRAAETLKTLIKDFKFTGNRLPYTLPAKFNHFNARHMCAELSANGVEAIMEVANG